MFKDTVRFNLYLCEMISFVQNKNQLIICYDRMHLRCCNGREKNTMKHFFHLLHRMTADRGVN